MLRRVHLIVRGLVQGVFFRASTVKQASALGVSGVVRNLADGSVEVVAEGGEAALRELVAWCRHGPPGARVSSLEEAWGESRAEFDSFRIGR